MNTSLDLLPIVSFRFLAALAASVVVAYVAVRLTAGPANSLAKRGGLIAIRAVLILLLLGLLANPVRVSELPGSTTPSDVFYLLDASESMAMGDDESTRWDQAVRLVRDSAQTALERATAQVRLFQFGRRLQAIGNPKRLGLASGGAGEGGIQFAEDKTNTAADQAADDPVLGPSEPDTQLLVALRQISSRFGRQPPSSIVLFSDGRARDADHVDEVASHFAELNVPIHVVPIGDAAKGGDISIVSVVAPSSVRKQSQVTVYAFVRSYGFDGKRTEISLNAIDDAGQLVRKLDGAPITLQSGFQSISFSFRSDVNTRNLQISVAPLPDEISTDNNRFETEVAVDRTKIRVLYLEGSPLPSVPTFRNGRLRGPHSDLQEALEGDPDIECAVLQVFGRRIVGVSGQIGSFPRTTAELSAFDAIILSSVPRASFTDEQLEWLDGWISRRGGGLCMVGGRYSFSAGGWDGTAMEKMLPVDMGEQNDWNSALPVAIHANVSGKPHPLFQILDDQKRNQQVLNSFPSIRGANLSLRPKPNLTTVLAVGTGDGNAPAGKLFTVEGIRSLFAGPRPQAAMFGGGEFPALAVGQYGRGRTMTLSTPITDAASEKFRNWGTNGNQYYTKFWRNAIYWLTESSFIGRRRLVAAADKRYYSPGETITLTCSAYDEGASDTSDYRVEAMIEPQSFEDIDSDYSVIRWPNNVERVDGEGPFVMWGEVFELPVKELAAGRDAYTIELQIADALLSGTANQSMRVELTAYEDATQVDSTSVAIQVLHDPFEQQNPFPHHDLLARLATESGGSVLKSAEDIADMLARLPVTTGPSEIRKAPVWSSWWLLAVLLGVVSTEWCWRRWIGLA